MRAIIVIFPYWGNETNLERGFTLAQLSVAIIVVVIVAQSYKYHLGAIKYGLYLQSLIFILSNFNMYKSDVLNNYQGLNILSAVFSMIFTVMNVVLATMVNVNQFENQCFSITVFMSEIASIVLYEFQFGDDMSYHTIQSLILSMVFACLIAPAIGYFSKALIEEMLTQARLNYAERDSYK